ncbi:MAG: substrate-binding domain-containing protein [Armatimonadota bacterium]|nr:MAG: substrate-binding domain-containing protein [Armatimonadota bacterium]
MCGAAALCAGCGARQKAGGTVRVSGAWALYPMMVSWAEEYQKLHPEVRIDVSAGGAGKGAADALGGLVDIGMVSRDIHPDETAKGGFWVSVVKDAVIPTANAANPVAQELAQNGVKRETFAALWVEGKALTWGDVAGRPDIADKVQVYTRSDACGAADTWAKYLGKSQEDLEGVAVYGDPGLADAVKKDPLGVGYNNLNYAYDAATGKPVAGLIPVPIDINGNGTLDADESFYSAKSDVIRAIKDGVYPSPPARDLNLLTKGKPTGLTREFILWILGDGQQFVDEAGYIQLPQEKLTASFDKLR